MDRCASQQAFLASFQRFIVSEEGRKSGIESSRSRGLASHRADLSPIDALLHVYLLSFIQHIHIQHIHIHHIHHIQPRAASRERAAHGGLRQCVPQWHVLPSRSCCASDARRRIAFLAGWQ
jgi:hypothetical protein